MVLGLKCMKECRLYSKCFLGILKIDRGKGILLVMKPFNNDRLKLLNIELYTLEYNKNRITERHIIQYTEIFYQNIRSFVT